MACGADRADNLARATALVRAAAAAGARVILLPELFDSTYFCQDIGDQAFSLAAPPGTHPTILHMSALARELGVVLPVSFFEKAGEAYFDSVAIIDADGQRLGVYRKSHIPQSPGYEERHYFSPGEDGFRVWRTRHCAIGVAICWDQWYPEAARILALAGAEMLLYPSAIGSEPSDPALDSKPAWQRVMQGHAAANGLPVAAANRIGVEAGRGSEITFYGGSFVADEAGAIVAELGPREEGFRVVTLDLAAIAARRAKWGVLEGRRPDLYGALVDGVATLPMNAKARGG
jgi:N-carbamoylputrescine amidase